MAERWNNPYSPDICDKVHELFSGGASIAKVCVKLGIVKDTYYRWKREHKEFAAAAEAGELASQVHWEDLGESGIIGELDKFAASSWMFVMKNRFRQDYRDEAAVQTNNTLIEKLLEKL